ncbi:ferritin-like domain-containing protein [Pendulispora albinea]|uniref:Ferritin-like domain-containing protein n=1 Tax=Pendulispora albinea TaxID=2741071 RepID=A0ABZ2M3W9_9BACT
MNENELQLDLNRTGIGIVPARSKELIASVSSAKPSSEGNEELISDVRNTYTEPGSTIGHIPAPVSEDAVETVIAEPAEGQATAVLVDKLGERLAFERTGVRLYDALIAKFDAAGKLDGDLTRAELVAIRDEEHQHFRQVKSAIEKLGGDPTVVTPSADLAGVKAMGLPQVLTDPRTTLVQALEAILVAELVDNEGWSTLIELAEKLGHSSLAIKFRKALASEEEHLAKVRGWVKEMTLSASAA